MARNVTPDDLHFALDELGLTRAAFAALCGVERETVYRWLREPDAKGWIPVPVYAETIINLLRDLRGLHIIANTGTSVGYDPFADERGGNR